jgi:quercetin dioxygenase-like cupin family protein
MLSKAAQLPTFLWRGPMQTFQAGVNFAMTEFAEVGQGDVAKLGYRLGEEEGEAFWVLGMLETIKISREDTAGQFGLIEIVVPTGLGSRWHVHPDEDEWFYVLEGEFTFYVGNARLSLPAGSFAFGPKGVPHTFITEPPEGEKAVVGFQPCQFQGFIREVGEPAPERVVPPPLETPPDMERLIPIAAQHGMDILGPPRPPPDDSATGGARIAEEVVRLDHTTLTSASGPELLKNSGPSSYPYSPNLVEGSFSEVQHRDAERLSVRMVISSSCSQPSPTKE